MPDETRRSPTLSLIGRGLLRDRSWRALLPDARPLTQLEPGDEPVEAIAAIAGSQAALRAAAVAAQRQLPCVLLQSGLLRAPRFGGRTAPLLSLMALEVIGRANPLGFRPPDSILAEDGWATESVLARARSAMASLLGGRAGGDWWAPEPARKLPANVVLVVCGRNLEGGAGGSVASIDRLLDTALASHEAARIVIVQQRDRRVRAAWRAVVARAAALGCLLIDYPVNPASLVDAATHIYTTDHELGFLGLIAGRAVHCATPSFFAGWGVTHDGAAISRRATPRSVEAIFAATCLLATRYADPFSGQPCRFEDTLDLIGEWRRLNDTNRAVAVCVGMSFWKRRRIGEFLAAADTRPRFVRGAARAARLAERRGGATAVWASREPAGLRRAAARRNVPVLTVEDGFLRSVGLGADFMPAASLVVDRQGIYYDPSQPSDLETLLAETTFDAALIARSRQLIRVLVTRGITKYNTGGNAVPDLGAPAGASRILVPGQVEDDRSVRLGGAGITGNLDLLRRVRAACPNAFIVYKPHPDVDAGHRRGAIPDATAARYADRIVRNVSSAVMLGMVDEIHTLTSLVGFEGLLRSRRVTVYGQPFYAGWGLTTDQAPPPPSSAPADGGRACRRRADPLSALSRSGDAAAVRS